MSKKDRLNKLINYYANGNKREFAEMIGISPQGVSTWLSRDSYDVELLYSKCVGVSADWLLSGNGDMILQAENDNQKTFNTKTPKKVIISNDNLNDNLNDNFPKLPKRLSNDDIKSTDLKAPEREPKYVSYGMPKEPDIVLLKGGEDALTSNIGERTAAVRVLESQQIPLYEFEATAGLANVFNSTGTPIDHLSIPNLPLCDGAIFVRGDSMYPLLKPGDVVVFKLNNSLKYILWGDVYIISFSLDGDEYAVVKMIHKSNQPNYVKLTSYNNDNYPPMEIPMESIRQLAHVKAWIHYNTMG